MGQYPNYCTILSVDKDRILVIDTDNPDYPGDHGELPYNAANQVDHIIDLNNLTDYMQLHYGVDLTKVKMGHDITDIELQRDMLKKALLEIKPTMTVEQAKGIHRDKFDKSKNKGRKFVPRLKSAKPLFGRNDPCPCGSGLKYKKCSLRGHCDG